MVALFSSERRASPESRPVLIESPTVRVAWPLRSRQKELGAYYLEASGWERPQWFEANHVLTGAQWESRTGWAAQNWSPCVGAEHIAKGLYGTLIIDRTDPDARREALRRYADNPGAARVVAAATTQEEIAWHGGGALVCTNCISPQMALVVDVTFGTDYPTMEKKEIGDHRLGGGPVLSRGSIISPVVFTLLRESAERLKLPYSVHAVGRDTSTNADAIHISREGVATGLVSIPNRYMHSPNEMVSLRDVDAAATLLADTCRAVTRETDFTAR